MASEDEYDDDVKKSSVVEAGAEHDEGATLDADQMTAWQCMLQNPKIVLWTLYANSTSFPRLWPRRLIY
jgi:hypothetical protein